MPEEEQKSLWIQIDQTTGKKYLIVDTNGHPILCTVCPCDKCEGLGITVTLRYYDGVTYVFPTCRNDIAAVYSGTFRLKYTLEETLAESYPVEVKITGPTTAEHEAVGITAGTSTWTIQGGTIGTVSTHDIPVTFTITLPSLCDEESAISTGVSFDICLTPEPEVSAGDLCYEVLNLDGGTVACQECNPDGPWDPDPTKRKNFYQYRKTAPGCWYNGTEWVRFEGSTWYLVDTAWGCAPYVPQEWDPSYEVFDPYTIQGYYQADSHKYRGWWGAGFFFWASPGTSPSSCSEESHEAMFMNWSARKTLLDGYIYAEAPGDIATFTAVDAETNSNSGIYDTAWWGDSDEWVPVCRVSETGAFRWVLLTESAVEDLPVILIEQDGKMVEPDVPVVRLSIEKQASGLSECLSAYRYVTIQQHGRQRLGNAASAYPLNIPEEFE